MLGEMRRFEAAAQDHTYTRAPTVGLTDGNGDPLLDDWGHQLTETAPGEEGVACKLAIAESVARDDRGTVITRTPALWIAHDDPLQPGDLVLDVRASDGRLLLASAAVLRVEPAANQGQGGVLSVLAELAGAETVVQPPGGQP
jgi:hypothetical protein